MIKKILSVSAALILILCLFGCTKKADTSAWQANDVFKDVPIYSYGDTISAIFGSSANIQIKDNSYENFLKYIEDLKESGFEYLKNGTIPENINLYNGSAQWRCTNGKVYLQLIFSEDGCKTYDTFKCNLQIYGYNDSKYLLPESDKQDKKDKKDKTDKQNSKQDKKQTEGKKASSN